MDATTLSARLGLWRVTRHPLTRRLYDTIEQTGLFAAQLDRFEREAVASVDAPGHPPSVVLSVSTIGEEPAGTLPPNLADEPLAPSDTLVRATRRGETVGYCCLSNRPVYVPELHRRLHFEGRYLWKLYVTASERGQGIGSAIIANAIEETAIGDRLIALVAPDNLPSRRAFRSLGFHPTERFTSVGYRSTQYHRREPLAGRPAMD